METKVSSSNYLQNYNLTNNTVKSTLTNTPVIIPASTRQVEQKPQAKTKNKGALIGLSAAIGVGAIVTAGILINRNRVPSEVRKAIHEAGKTNTKAQKLAAKVQDEAQIILSSVGKVKEDAQKIVDEVVDLFKKGEEKGYKDITNEEGKIIKKFSQSGEGENAAIELNEFEADGTTLLRSSTKYSKDDALSINDFAKKIEIRQGKGEIESIEEGYEKLADGNEKSNKIFFFNDRKLNNCIEGIEGFADGSSKTNKLFHFYDEKLTGYEEGYENLADRSVKSNKILGFDDKKITEYNEGYEKLADKSMKINKCLNYHDDKLHSYTEGIENIKDKSIKINKCLNYTDGKPCSYAERIENSADGVAKSNKMFGIDEKTNKWKEVDLSQS